MNEQTLGPERIEELVKQTVQGLTINDRVMATSALQQLFEEGTPIDAAAFVVGGYSILRSCLPWATMGRADGHDSVLAATLHGAMLSCYLAGDRDGLLDLFFCSPGDIASEALGIALRVTADTVRSYRARMN